jgi:hypothetical protein
MTPGKAILTQHAGQLPYGAKAFATFASTRAKAVGEA